MNDTALEQTYYAIEHGVWWASLRIIRSENERDDDVYIGFLINHMRIAETTNGFRLLLPEDYDTLVEFLRVLCEALDRPYVNGILEALLNATVVNCDGAPVDA
jgi:hypothetical protein